MDIPFSAEEPRQAGVPAGDGEGRCQISQNVNPVFDC